MFSLPELVLIGIAYLLFLFGAAYLTERGWIPSRLVRHPLTHVLSIGVYASVWSFYGAFGLAEEGGYTFLVSYAGAAAAFALAPALLIPILRITRTYQLSSLADLFAFRFRSGALGTLTSLLTVLATLPLLSIQIGAVADALHLINGDFNADQIAFGFCGVIALFAILFGARHAALRTQHPGLVVAMAVESLIKLVAILLIGLYALFVVLGGTEGLQAWLIANPDAGKDLFQNVDSGLWRSLVLAFFASAVVMPHMFHMLFTENASDETLYKASWGMPLFLLLMALGVPVILWAGQALGVGGEAHHVMFYLGMQLGSEWLTVLAFIGGLSAASGILIVATVSMASMLQNHLILPLIPLPDTTRFYAWLLWLRRTLIVTLVLASYLFYRLIASDSDLQPLGIITVFAFLQFLPALLATLYWARANRWGVIIGLLVGMSSWLLTMLLPLFHEAGQSMPFQLAATHWDQTAMMSLLLNAVVMICISLLTPSSPEEQRSAEACLVNALQQPNTDPLQASRPEDFVSLLSPRLGADAARREVRLAAEMLALSDQHLRPIDLLRLRSQLEHNLSGLLGPVEAASMLEPLSRKGPAVGFKARNVHLLETQLENYQEQVTGLAAELDKLRRYHKLTLQKLPIGVCTLDGDSQVLLWNAEMERYTELDADDCVGTRLDALPAPWGELLSEFIQQPEGHLPSHCLERAGSHRWYGLHKARLSNKPDSGMVILMEDETEDHLMQQTMAHSERLASIGRFAAGVAHEIGNPVTGIACLAQNLKLETDNPDILETGDQIVGQTKRIGRIVDSLVRFAHAGRQEPTREHQPVSLFECVAEAIQLISLDTRGKQQHYLNEVPPEIRVSGNPQQLLQVFVNLLNNASDASELNGRIWIDAWLEEEAVIVTVTDEGSGIPPELQKQLFEPFFTTKEPGKGTGLGLALVYNIVEEHYGNIEIISPANNKQNKGTQVVITLPCDMPAAGSDTARSEYGEGQ
ncbi:sensor histidine kinase [Marinobacterium arenosum]|uniref:sensor histidine kinase n=1 Tax=Marinobacterium arenosum TaxID=2862496 RepID=UPI001C9635C6|nr:ATP-binding protein [Marinobacterium arenosum]MBY4678288.1 PAS domain-containing protein [Marinobacterium arenosum]